MMHTDYRTLLDRGRKSGLHTSELYSALASRSPQVNDIANGQADSNGFAATYNQDGQRVYQPVREQSN